MRRPARILREGRFLPQRMEEARAPARVEALGGLPRHPRGEALVQPQVVPPGHGDEVAEPLVRDLMRDDAVGRLLLAQRISVRVVEEAALVVGDRPPVFHRSGYAAMNADLFEFVPRVRFPEVALVIPP